MGQKLVDISNNVTNNDENDPSRKAGALRC